MKFIKFKKVSMTEPTGTLCKKCSERGAVCRDYCEVCNTQKKTYEVNNMTNKTLVEQIAECMLRKGKFTTSDVTKATKISKTSVSSITSVLCKTGFIEKIGMHKLTGIYRVAARYRFAEPSDVKEMYNKQKSKIKRERKPKKRKKFKRKKFKKKQTSLGKFFEKKTVTPEIPKQTSTKTGTEPEEIPEDDTEYKAELKVVSVVKRVNERTSTNVQQIYCSHCGRKNFIEK